MNRLPNPNNQAEDPLVRACVYLRQSQVDLLEARARSNDHSLSAEFRNLLREVTECDARRQDKKELAA